MKPYDLNKPIVFCHVPRTGGNSVMHVMRKWYPTTHQIPVQHPALIKGGWFAAEHFSRIYNRHVEVVLPGCDQYITFLRDPYERFLSWYGYWLTSGAPLPLWPKEETTFERFCYSQDHLMSGNCVANLPTGNYPKKLDDFVFVGFTEQLQLGINELADILDKPHEEVPRINGSGPRPEVDPELKRKIIRLLAIEYEIYAYAKSKWWTS